MSGTDTATLDKVDVSAEAQDAQALIDFLRDRDVACPLCRYNLRGLTSARCPECGRELRLSIGLVEPRQGAWLTAQIALTAAAGIGVMIVLVSSVQGWPRGNPRQTMLNAAFSFHLLMIPAAAGSLLFRRRYLRWSRARQWTGAALALAITLAGMIALMIVSV